MDNCEIMQCYYNHDGRCAIGSFARNDDGEWEKVPRYCPRREKE